MQVLLPKSHQLVTLIFMTLDGTQTISGTKTFSKSTILNSTLSVGGNSIFTGNVGIGTTNLGESNFCIQSTGYAHISNDQHKTQLSLENSKNPVGGYNSKMGIGVMDDGKGTIQILKFDDPAGYKDLLLQSIGGNVGIGTNNATEKLHVFQPIQVIMNHIRYFKLLEIAE